MLDGKVYRFRDSVTRRVTLKVLGNGIQRISLGLVLS